MKSIKLFKRMLCLIAVIITLLTIGTPCANAKSTPDLLARTLKEYRSILHDMPSSARMNLISYNMLKGIGKFDFFCVISLWEIDIYNEYYYVLCDEEEYSFFLTIYDKTSERVAEYYDVYHNVTVANFPKDPRHFSTDDVNSFVSVGDVMYRYGSNQLIEIIWETDLHMFSLSSATKSENNNFNFDNYVSTQDTFLSKLLNTDTAEQAVAELNERIERNLAWNRFMAKATVPLIITGIALLALISFLVIRKNVLLRKAKEKAMLFERDNQQNDPLADSNEPTPPVVATDNIT